MTGEYLRRACNSRGAVAAIAVGLTLTGCDELRTGPANYCHIDTRLDNDTTTVLRLPEDIVTGVKYDTDTKQVAVHGYSGDIDPLAKYDLSSGAETLALTDAANVPEVYFVIDDDSLFAECVYK